MNRTSGKHAKTQPRNSKGQWVGGSRTQPSMPDLPSIDLKEQPRRGLLPVPVEDIIPNSIEEFVSRLRNAADALDGIASEHGITGQGVLDRTAEIENSYTMSDSLRSLTHSALVMHQEGICDPPPVVEFHSPFQPEHGFSKLREWAESVKDGTSWARRAAKRLSYQAEYTAALVDS